MTLKGTTSLEKRSINRICTFEDMQKIVDANEKLVKALKDEYSKFQRWEGLNGNAVDDAGKRDSS